MKDIIKYKRIGDDLVLIIEGNIITRKIPDEQFFSDISESVSLYNESIDDEESLSLQGYILTQMLPPKLARVFDKSKIKNLNQLAEVESYENASKDYERAKLISELRDDFDYDSHGHVYLSGYSVPIPVQLADAIYSVGYEGEDKYTLDSLVNFWKWALLNPNQKARVDLFKWFDTGEFVITNEGFVIAYRNLNIHRIGINEAMENFVNKHFLLLKQEKDSPDNYYVVIHDDEYKLVHVDDETLGQKIDKLSVLYADIRTNNDSTIYTDNHTGTMRIRMGKEVTMPREECDENHEIGCSSGLHFMSPEYGLRLGQVTVVVAINPYNIVAFPSYDNTKGRTCSYLPIGMADKKITGEIIPIKSGSYDFGNYITETLGGIMNDVSLAELKSKKLIAEDINEIDFALLKSNIKSEIEGRIQVVE